MKAIVWIVVLAALVAVGAFLLTRGGEAPETVEPTEQEEPTNVVPTPSTGGAAGGTMPALEPTDEPKFYITINYNAGAVFSAETYEVEQGQRVVLRVTSSANDTVTLEGYDIMAEAKAGVQTEMEFDAITAGRYAIRLETAGAVIGYLEVKEVE